MWQREGDLVALGKDTTTAVLGTQWEYEEEDGNDEYDDDYDDSFDEIASFKVQ